MTDTAPAPASLVIQTRKPPATMFPPRQDASLRGHFQLRKHGILRQEISDLSDQPLGHTKLSDPRLGSKRRQDEEYPEPTTKRHRYEPWGSSPGYLNPRALLEEHTPRYDSFGSSRGNLNRSPFLEERFTNDNAYVSPPASPPRATSSQALAPQVNSTTNLTRHPDFGFVFENRPRLGSSSSQDWTTLEPTGNWPWSRYPDHFPAGAQYVGHSSGVFPNISFSPLPQRVEKLTPLPVVRKPRNSLSVEDRKRFFIETPCRTLEWKMEEWVSAIYKGLKVARTDEECWLHPCPPAPKRNGRANGTIQRRFSWRNGKSHTLNINFGIVALMVKDLLTKDQKEGFVNKGWHLSHLCGNWTCCNWHHHTVEPGATNIKRNACFRHDDGCLHQPPCMKHLKRRDLLLVSETANDKSSV